MKNKILSLLMGTSIFVFGALISCNKKAVIPSEGVIVFWTGNSNVFGGGCSYYFDIYIDGIKIGSEYNYSLISPMSCVANNSHARAKVSFGTKNIVIKRLSNNSSCSSSTTSYTLDFKDECYLYEFF